MHPDPAPDAPDRASQAAGDAVIASICEWMEDTGHAHMAQSLRVAVQALQQRAAEAEREACARVCDASVELNTKLGGTFAGGLAVALARALADDIRARSARAGTRKETPDA